MPPLRWPALALVASPRLDEPSQAPIVGINLDDFGRARIEPRRGRSLASLARGSISNGVEERRLTRELSALAGEQRRVSERISATVAGRAEPTVWKEEALEQIDRRRLRESGVEVRTPSACRTSKLLSRDIALMDFVANSIWPRELVRAVG